MRKKHWLMFAAAAVVMVGVIVLFSPAPEPMYQGKPLNYWLRVLRISIPYPSKAKRAEAEAAIRSMGTNSFPALFRMIQHNENWFEVQMHKWTVQFQTGEPPDELDGINTASHDAMTAFGVLGSEAAPAVPQLIDIYNRRKGDWNRQDRIIIALNSIGRPAEPAIPILLEALSGPNYRMRPYVASTLGDIHADPEKVVPALISCLKDPDSHLRLNAVVALKKFGPDAKAAVPALLELIRDPNLSNGPTNGFKLPPGSKIRTPTVGEQVTNALWSIDPAAAARAGMVGPW